MDSERIESNAHRWRVILGWTTFAAIAALLLVSEHGLHALGYLPFLLLLACPLMHIFMHGGHRHGGHGQAGNGPDQASAPEEFGADRMRGA